MARGATFGGDSMTALVVYPGGKTREVRNLGWLLRRCSKNKPWQGVKQIAVINALNKNYDCLMIAIMLDGYVYSCEWQSREILRKWLHRPTIKGRDLVWFSEKTQC